MIDTDLWPAIRARWYTKWVSPTPGGRRPVRVVVIHDMEYPERSTAAEDVARYFATTDTKASAHICVDSDSIVQCVKDNDVAYAAPGANSDGIQIELAGYGRQTHAEWLDEYGQRLLARAGNAVAQYCLKYAIPVVHLTNDQLRGGQRGIVGHVQVSEVYRRSTHTDPGPAFPWSFLLEVATRDFAIRKAQHGAL